MKGCALPFSYTLPFSYSQSTKSVNYVEGLIAKEQQILVLLHQAIHVAVILIIIIMIIIIIMMMIIIIIIIITIIIIIINFIRNLNLQG